MKYAWLGIAALLALSACEEEADTGVSTETGGEAAGEILGGTISDDMIALEELTSTSPPAERQADPAPSAPSSTGQAAASEVEAEPEEASPEPGGPVTAGPSRPVPQNEEAGGPIINPPAF
ncbi:hypothetical protein INR77_14485 [Erythrobacter sp. SCSIO 43205]|uniref:hypothetical protein n=1 Tax=Erythrobacter sp. SCSIO 43205 TaxID=2779361 RepID=UPI001CA8FEFE|nr:hypothetical protein [Erythrobacter sp. SCSIO 43205]UAB77956.1 hypothetical protein INR77_14485 [Erythrobacter sp. SCSIO 43205]